MQLFVAAPSLMFETREFHVCYSINKGKVCCVCRVPPPPFSACAVDPIEHFFRSLQTRFVPSFLDSDCGGGTSETYDVFWGEIPQQFMRGEKMLSRG